MTSRQVPRFDLVSAHSRRDETGLLLEWSPGYQSGFYYQKEGGVTVEKVTNHTCPRCGQRELNVYYSEMADDRVGAWCEYCNLKAYYHGE